MESTLIPIAMFAMIVAIVVLPAYLRERTRQSAHRLIGQALEKGQTLDPQLMQELTASPQKQRTQVSAPRRTLGNGVVLLALAVGFGIAGFARGDFEAGDLGGMAAAALILGALGIAFTILAIVDYSTQKKAAE